MYVHRSSSQTGCVLGYMKKEENLRPVDGRTDEPGPYGWLRIELIKSFTCVWPPFGLFLSNEIFFYIFEDSFFVTPPAWYSSFG